MCDQPFLLLIKGMERVEPSNHPTLEIQGRKDTVYMYSETCL